MSYSFSAAAPVTPFPRANVRLAPRPLQPNWGDLLSTLRQTGSALFILGLAAAPAAFTIGMVLDAFGLRVL